MTKSDYNAVATIAIDAPVATVWDALINPDVVKKYLHDTTVESEWKVGSPITWHGVWNGQSYEDKGIVLAFEPNKLLKTSHWSPLSGVEDKPENYHIVSYELAAEGNETRITMTQTNNETQEAADTMVEKGWLPILRTLQSLLES